MFYKPNFCAECGEKIERVEWKPWTSRRFCDDCAAPLENSIRWKTGIAVIGLLVVGVFAGQIGRIAPKPSANAQTLVAANTTPNTAKSNQALITANNQPVLGNSATNSIAQTSASQNKDVVNPPHVVAVQTEASYYCGAKTQKGTICTRRVKGGGRCWQHIGKPAMLPQDRLLIQGN